ncbi:MULTISPECIES: histidine kinase [unclassified Cellulomonas]|uniref:histidine kinase n=1 Tax=unclassified Cellulomonas TaxID=2620175 RepID=UPI0024B70FEB|nr:histidine kinase [Cellulomonas sp. ES6]WHP16795.1 histidine kinase [Cellulomonas sp. ES6]
MTAASSPDRRPDDPRPAGAPAPEPEAPVAPGTADGPAAEPEPAGPLDEAALARVAEPARVRRAPKVGAFITAGVLVGALVGLVAALVAGPSSEVVADGTAFISLFEGQGGARLVSAVIGAFVGAFAGAGLAVLAERRSVRRAAGDDAGGARPR